MKDFIKQFKEFAVKGNMLDMAIGIIIGTGFSRIVNSLVKDLITPFFGYMIGDMDFTDYRYELRPRELDEGGNVVREAMAINYGNFIQASLDFLLVALSIFVVIRVINQLKRKAENEENPTVPTPKNIELLSEIRDLLRQKQKE